MVDKILRADSTPIANIKSCTFTEQVNAEENLRFGSCVASSIKFEAFGTQSDAPAVGEVLTYYQTDDLGVDTLIGKFIAQPSIPGKGSYSVTAYDNIALLETDFSEHLASIESSFPMTLSSLLAEVATVAGVTFGNSPTGAADTINFFSASGVTCRNIVSWAAELSGQYAYADTSGDICFGWYAAASAYKIYPTSGSSGGVTYVAYREGGLDYKDFPMAVVDGVSVNPSLEGGNEEVYPTGASGNIYTVSDNILMTDMTSANLQTIAQRLYTVLAALPAYRQCTARLFRSENPLRAGDIVAVEDAQGVTFNTLVMMMTVNESGATVDCSGRETYDDDDGSTMGSKLTNISANIVRIDKAKIDWADINTAIVNYLTANNVTAQNLTIVDENDTVLATFDGNGIILGQIGENYAKIDFNSLELYDKDGTRYLFFGDDRDQNGEAQYAVGYYGNGHTTTFDMIPETNDTSSVEVTVDGTAVTPASVTASQVTLSSAPASGEWVEITYTTTDPVHHYDMGERAAGIVGINSIVSGEEQVARGTNSATVGGKNHVVYGESAAVVGGYDNEARGKYSALIGGHQNQALANDSVVVGGDFGKTSVSASLSVVVGGNANVVGSAKAVAIGGMSNTVVQSEGAVVMGKGSWSNGQYSLTFGKYNKNNVVLDTYVEQVGGGTDNNNRADIRTLDWSGNEVLAGGLKVFGNKSVVHSGSLKVYSKTSSGVSVAAGSAMDWYINFSQFGSSGTPIAIAGWQLDGTGVSQFTVYRVLMDTANSRFQIAARNRDSTARTITATINALFLE